MCEFDRLMEEYAKELARKEVEKAVAEARSEAAEAKHKNCVDIAKGLFADGISIEIIAKNTKLPIEEVRALCLN